MQGCIVAPTAHCYGSDSLNLRYALYTVLSGLDAEIVYIIKMLDATVYVCFTHNISNKYFSRSIY